MKPELRKSQIEYLARLGDKPFMWADPGTGKTIMSLELAKRSGAKKVLIVAPAPLVNRKPYQWKSEVAKFGYDEYFDEMQIVAYHHLLKYNKKPQQSYADYFVIFDEAHKLKNPQSQQGAGGFKLVSHGVVGYILMTGTPMSKWEDAVNYAKITGLVKHKTEFVNRFEIITKVKGKSGREFPIISYRDEETLTKWWVSISSRLKLDDCADLPSKQHIRVPFELSRAKYNGTKKTATTQLGKTITWYEDEDGNRLDTISGRNWYRMRYCEASKEKIDWVVEKAESTPNLIIFCVTKKGIHAVSEALHKKHIKHGIYGDGRHDDYHKNKVMIVQYQAGGTGLNLQHFNYTVFMSPSPGHANWVQAIGRTYRTGQEKKTVFYELEAKGMIDTSAYKRLAEGKDFVMSLEEEA